MSRSALVTTSLLLLAAALLVALAEGYFQSLSVGSVVVATAAIYGVSAVVPLIIWAFGRFRLQKAIVPVATWGVLLVLVGTAHGLAAVAAARAPGLAAMLAGFLEIPAVKEGFREGFVASATQSCIATAKAKSTTLSDVQLAAYCACTATQMVDTLTTQEMVDLMRSSDALPPALRSKLFAITATCRADPSRRDL
jgi:hypothetical protein